jgi:hypothetical protein
LLNFASASDKVLAISFPHFPQNLWPFAIANDMASLEVSGALHLGQVTTAPQCGHLISAVVSLFFGSFTRLPPFRGAPFFA